MSKTDKHLVLVGGGHSHAILAKLWARQPLPNIQLTLISPQALTPYSGMLPGLIAGHYSLDETHIDLEKLCQASNIHFILGRVTHIDLQQRLVNIDQQQNIKADLISIDTGATPDLSVTGSDQYTIPVKPIARFYHEWQQIKQELASRSQQPKTCVEIGVVGGGAAGVELVLAMKYYCSTRANFTKTRFHLIHPGEHVPEGYSKRLQNIVHEKLRKNNIEVHSNFWVDEVNANEVVSHSRGHIALNKVFWCTQAAAPSWPRDSGLAVSNNGFIAVDYYLRCIDYPWIFAAGDVAEFIESPHAKAGVYAVRQAPVLYHNVRHTLEGKKLKSFKPQKQFLSLLACGEKTAVGGKYGLTVSGSWVWHWKNFLDRRFMQQFQS